MRISVSGVRSSCEALATNRRWLANAPSSRASMASKVPASSFSSSGGRSTRPLTRQRFITGASLPGGMAFAGGYIYWANNAAGTIGRARLNGTGVSQHIITMHGRPTGVAVDPYAT